MEITFDPQQLTVGDVEDLEDIVGKPYEEMDFSKPSGKLIKGLVFISGRHENPDFTLDDARQVRVAEISTKPDPTQDGGAS